MKEAEYIEATNLAKVRIAQSAMADTLPGYGPVTDEKRLEIVSLLSDLLQECFDAISTSQD